MRFQTVRHAFIFTPGDNDWSDCWRLQARKVDPLERLARIRALFFPEGKSLGQKPIAVRQQSSDTHFSKFRENLRFAAGGVLFITLHTVGDNDNFGRTPGMDAEHLERKAANLAWLKQAFAEARATNALGLVIRPAAVQPQDEPRIPELHARGDLRLAGEPLGSYHRGPCRSAALSLQGRDRPGQYRQCRALVEPRPRPTCGRGMGVAQASLAGRQANRLHPPSRGRTANALVGRDRRRGPHARRRAGWS